MTTIKYTLSIFVLFIIMSCGQSDTTSSKAIAESKPNNISKEKIEESSVDLVKTVSKEIDESKAVADAPEIELEEEESEVSNNNSGNIENPSPVKVSQKAETKVKEVIEKVIEKKEATPIEVPKAEKAAVVNVSNTKEESIAKVADEKPEVESMPEPIIEAVPMFSHESFNNLLKKHVSSSGKVNYNNFKTEESKLDAYLKALDENPPAADWSKSKKMAYWINAYNAGTIKLILKNYPVKSITKLHGGKPWDQKWIPLGGKTYSLDHIENDILRPVYKDARIHFAVNCAAKSCPPLLNKAWTESNLKSALEKQTKSFVNDPSQNTISADAVEISKIFEWYAVDFGDIVSYLNKYSTVKINPGAKVTYKEYNWDLNK